jgi:hypothetical protein
MKMIGLMPRKVKMRKIVVKKSKYSPKNESDKDLIWRNPYAAQKQQLLSRLGVRMHRKSLTNQIYKQR